MEPALSGDFGKLMKLADKIAKLKVRTNADTPHDAKVAREFGAKGIGLCRTEHMFFEGGKIKAMREMILADDWKRTTKSFEEIITHPAQRFRRYFRSHARSAGNNSFARSAIARICSSRRRKPKRNGKGNGHYRSRK